MKRVTKSEAAVRRAQSSRSPEASIRRCGRSAAWAAIRRFIARGEGSHMFDVDGNEYIDYVGSWGPLLLGHRHPGDPCGAANGRSSIGTSFGAPTEREVELAEEIREAVPSIEMVRLVNSGTEATMSAIRVARGFTGRDLTVKFEGCYHGHVDSLLVKRAPAWRRSGSPIRTASRRLSADTTIALPFNSVDALEQAFRAHGDTDRVGDRRARGRATWAACRRRPAFSKRCARSRRGTARC